MFLCEGPIPSSQIFCARVLSPPFKCLVRVSYPLQLIVLCEGPIPFSLYAMPIGFGFLAHVVLSTPISTRWFSPFTFGAGNVCFSLLQLRGDGVIFSPCQIGSKTTRWALHRALLVYLGVLCGELLPAAPLQPCTEAPLGRGHIVTLLDWVNLVPGHYASNYAHLAIQA